MAKRDLDVVIGARTDNASFTRAEQKTKSLFARLRGAGGDGPTALERSQRLLGQVAAVTATIVAVKEVANVLNSASSMFAAKSAEARGDIEAAAEAWSSSIETLRGGTITGPFVQMAEAIESLAGIDTLAEVQAQIAKSNSDQAKLQAQREADAKRSLSLSKQAVEVSRQLFKEAERADVEARGDALEIEIFNISEARDAQLKKIHLLKQEVKEKALLADKEKALAALEDARQRAYLNAADKIARAEAAAAEQDEVVPPVEAITEEVADDPFRGPSRVGGAAAQTGLLMRGFSAAAQADKAIITENKQQNTITAKNTTETVAVLRELLLATKGGAAPILN